MTERLPIQPGNWASVNDYLADHEERTTIPYTVYVDQTNGSDQNTGKGPGAAVQTLAYAARLLRLGTAPSRGRIKFVAVGIVDVSEPLHFSAGVSIECLGAATPVIRRNFDTPNSRSVWDAVTTVSGTTINSATAAFVSGDVNKIISVYGAGVGSGTFYDFIASRTDASNVVTTAATTKARNNTTDPKGVKLTICGDWNRVVTDASMTSGQSTVTSATAAWTDADINRELVIAGAGQGGQALRTVIVSYAGNVATVLGVSSNTVNSARCAIGVNFGDLITYHAGGGGIRDAEIRDDTTGKNRIGSALKIVSEDQGSGAQPSPSDLYFENLRITCSDTNGGWEHDVDADGSWNQSGSGPGARRISFVGCKFFGVRRPTETLRLASVVHWSFVGGGIVGAAPTNIGQGYAILDPQKVGGGSISTEDVNFVGCEGVGAYYYSEGSRVNYVGGSLAAGNAVSGRVVIELGATADHNTVITSNAATTNATETDSGTNNRILTNVSTPQTGAALATNATGGFNRAASCAGTPSGTPVAVGSSVPFLIDTTGSKLWAYIGGAWKSATLA